MARLLTRSPPADGGYPLDSDLHQMTDDGGPPAPDPARWIDPVWRDRFAGDVRPEPVPADDTASGWTLVALAMPPEGVLVDTLTGDRRLKVKWENRLWRLSVGTHVPYFTPDYWRPARRRARNELGPAQ